MVLSTAKIAQDDKSLSQQPPYNRTEMKIITGKVFMGRILSQPKETEQQNQHELHLPKIPHTDGGSSHTIDSDFKLKGKNIRS